MRTVLKRVILVVRIKRDWHVMVRYTYLPIATFFRFDRGSLTAKVISSRKRRSTGNEKASHYTVRKIGP